MINILCFLKTKMLPWPFWKSMGPMLKQTLKEIKNLPEKISGLISTPNSEFPANNITLHFSILLTNKVLIVLATPNNSKHSLILECGTIAFL